MLRTGGHNRQEVTGHYAMTMFIFNVVPCNVKVRLSPCLIKHHNLNKYVLTPGKIALSTWVLGVPESHSGRYRDCNISVISSRI